MLTFRRFLFQRKLKQSSKSKKQFKLIASSRTNFKLGIYVLSTIYKKIKKHFIVILKLFPFDSEHLQRIRAMFQLVYDC